MLRALVSSGIAIFALSAAAPALHFTDLDLDNDRFVTLDELRVVFPAFSQSDFHAIDTNTDNRLSSAELQASGASAMVERYRPNAVVIHGMSEIDRNGDLFASQAEIAAIYPGFSTSDYRRIDRNSDNRVSAAELYTPLAQTLAKRYEVAQVVKATIDDVDLDNDNFASFGEMTSAFPGLTALDFEIIDQNSDNRVASGEFYDLDSQIILDRQ